MSLHVDRGSIFGFIGPNGAGKTTTIRLLMGLLTPTTGRVTVLGYDTRTDSQAIRSQTGALLEHTGLYEQLSVEDNLEFYARVWDMPTQERRNRIKILLDRIDLWDRRKDLVGTWSTGMKQKLALARTVLHSPSLIILDEPTSGLDVAAAVALRQDLKFLSSGEGVTVFLKTHNMTDIE